jgi:hypothetical protein
MLTRAMTKEIEAKAEYIKMFIDNHKMIRNQPDRIYEQTIKWFRKHSIELPAGVRERSEREFVQIFMQWLGLPNCVPLTCSECKGTYTLSDGWGDNHRCIGCTNKERRQRHKCMIRFTV